MVEERKLAKENGHESPIWETIEETHSSYNANMRLLLNSAGKHDAIFLASHNVDTVTHAKELIGELGIKD